MKLSPSTQRILLMASVLLNIFFISWGLSHWLKDSALYPSLLKNIPVEARPIFQKNLQANKAELITALKQLKRHRQVLSTLLQQEPLDIHALRASTTQAKASLHKMIEILQKARLATFTNISPQVRQKWAEKQQQNNLLFDQLIHSMEASMENEATVN